MKEDVLEQLIDDYLKAKGYFTQHNVKFRPCETHREYGHRFHSVPSDIDLLAVHPLRSDKERVWVVSCKAWQAGFDPERQVSDIVANRRVAGREAWKLFRELCTDIWADALLRAVERATGTREFVYVVAVTVLKNEAKLPCFEQNPEFLKRLKGNPIRVLALRDVLRHLWDRIALTPEPSAIGRTIQLMKAARWTPPSPGRAERRMRTPIVA